MFISLVSGVLNAQLWFRGRTTSLGSGRRLRELEVLETEMAAAGSYGGWYGAATNSSADETKMAAIESAVLEFDDVLVRPRFASTF